MFCRANSPWAAPVLTLAVGPLRGLRLRVTSSFCDRQQLPTQQCHRLDPSLLRKAANLGSARRSLKAGSGVQARLAANSGWRCSTARCSHWRAGSSSLRYASRLTDLLAQQREVRGLQLLLQDLDGEPLAAQLLIGDQVHHPHPPFTELALDAVAAANQLTERQPHRVG